MDSELKSSGAGMGVSIAVGERVTLADSEAEYVVVNVDHARGRLELLRLKPGRIEGDIPVSSVRKRSQAAPHGSSSEDN